MEVEETDICSAEAAAEALKSLILYKKDENLCFTVGIKTEVQMRQAVF